MSRSRFLYILLISLCIASLAMSTLPQQVDNSGAGGLSKTINLTINNKGEKRILLVLDGKTKDGLFAVYNFTVLPGKTGGIILAGKYQATFTGCGRQWSRNLSLKNDTTINVICREGKDGKDQIDLNF